MDKYGVMDLLSTIWTLYLCFPMQFFFYIHSSLGNSKKIRTLLWMTLYQTLHFFFLVKSTMDYKFGMDYAYFSLNLSFYSEHYHLRNWKRPAQHSILKNGQKNHQNEETIHQCLGQLPITSMTARFHFGMHGKRVFDDSHVTWELSKTLFSFIPKWKQAVVEVIGGCPKHWYIGFCILMVLLTILSCRMLGGAFSIAKVVNPVARYVSP